MSFDIPSRQDLWFLPLGGCGEIGMNLNLYAHDGQWLMVDCGVSFSKPPDTPEGALIVNNDVICADPSFISHRRKRLTALIITHAHEDHVGAAAHLWKQFQCPIYTTAFTAEILNRKLSEAGLSDKVVVNIVGRRDRINIGSFDVQWFPLTHSIPEPQALVIRTPAGNVFHTADWKLDPEPVVGSAFKESDFKQLASENIAAIVCDSTNAPTSGRSESEAVVAQGLLETIKKASGRVIVTCFGSNVARMQSIVRAAIKTDRYPALLGRSLHKMYQAARATGYWPDELKLISASHLGYLPTNEVLAIATGSQGEARTALRRLAEGTHPDLDLERDDTVIFSSKTIPGNEAAIAKLCEKLSALGVTLVTSSASDLPIHATGHPCEDELSDVYRWVKPAIAIPVHGEKMHMESNANIAKNAGVKSQFTGQNGDLFMLAPQPRVRRKFCEVGIINLSEQMQN